MHKRNRSGKVTQLRIRLTHLDLLAFLLTALLVLAMEGLSRADIWDETLAAARKEGNLISRFLISRERAEIEVSGV